MPRPLIHLVLLLFVPMISCERHSAATLPPGRTPDFDQDVDFLRKHTETCLLGVGNDSMRVVIAPQWQGAVMTTCTSLENGSSHGFIAYNAIEWNDPGNAQNPNLAAASNDQGGMDRLMLLDAPPGSDRQLSLRPLPKPIHAGATSDTLFNLEAEGSRSGDSQRVRSFRVERAVQVIDKGAVARILGTPVSNTIRTAAFRSTNLVKNIGTESWDESHGWFDLHLSGSLKPGPGQTLVVRYRAGSATPPKLDPKSFRIRGDVLFFKSNGELDPAEGVLSPEDDQLVGSYDSVRGTLTLVQSRRVTAGGGESSNTGPPVIPLKPGQSSERIRTTIHFEGTWEELDPIAQHALGVSIPEIVTAFDDSRAVNEPTPSVR